MLIDFTKKTFKHWFRGSLWSYFWYFVWKNCSSIYEFTII